MAAAHKGRRQRVVIYRLGSLGDTVVALPCFHQIAATWPDAERIVLTNFPVSAKAAPLEVILRASGLIDSAIAYPVGTRSVTELWDLARRLRSLDADVLVYLTPARGLNSALRDFLFFKLCGFGRIVGMPKNSDLQHPRVVTDGSGREILEERECERLARCLHELGPLDLDDPKLWDLRLTAEEIESGTAARRILSSTAYFAVNMGGKAVQKDWGLENWEALLGALSGRQPGLGLLIIGAADDSARAQLVAQSWCGPFVDACGKLSPRESAAAMRGAVAFIGHDSGPLHLAAASGVPCVGLFGDHNLPNRWHPRGRQHRIIHKMSGLRDITVTEVLDAVDAVVARPAEYA